MPLFFDFQTKQDSSILFWIMFNDELRIISSAIAHHVHPCGMFQMTKPDCDNECKKDASISSKMKAKKKMRLILDAKPSKFSSCLFPICSWCIKMNPLSTSRGLSRTEAVWAALRIVSKELLDVTPKSMTLGAAWRLDLWALVAMADRSTRSFSGGLASPWDTPKNGSKWMVYKCISWEILLEWIFWENQYCTMLHYIYIYTNTCPKMGDLQVTIGFNTKSVEWR